MSESIKDKIDTILVTQESKQIEAFSAVTSTISERNIEQFDIEYDKYIESLQDFNYIAFKQLIYLIQVNMKHEDKDSYMRFIEYFKLISEYIIFKIEYDQKLSILYDDNKDEDKEKEIVAELDNKESELLAKCHTLFSNLNTLAESYGLAIPYPTLSNSIDKPIIDNIIKNHSTIIELSDYLNPNPYISNLPKDILKNKIDIKESLIKQKKDKLNVEKKDKKSKASIKKNITIMTKGKARFK